VYLRILLRALRPDLAVRAIRRSTVKVTFTLHHLAGHIKRGGRAIE